MSKSMDTFADFKGRHKNESILVLGLGESINFLDGSVGGNSIGVNDIGRKLTPTYLLNVNNRNQYKGDRFEYIEGTGAKYLFTHQPKEQGNVKCPIVTFDIARDVGTVEVVGNKMPHFRCSPYMAVALAGYMGASKVGIIGVDFTDNHFWIQDGRHRLLSELARIDAHFGKLAAHLWHTQQCEVVNLSPISRLQSLRKEDYREWFPN